MRKMIALLLALALLCAAAMAEEQAFSFRNGIAWGMTQTEVLAAEGSPEYELEAMQGGRTELEIDEIKDGEYEWELKYLFINDALTAAKYEFDAEDVSADLLGRAMDARYGERGAGDTGRFCELMSALLGREYALGASRRQGDFFFDWSAGDNYIALTNLTSDDGDDVLIYYFDGAALLAAEDMSVSEPAPALNPDEL